MSQIPSDHPILAGLGRRRREREGLLNSINPIPSPPIFGQGGAGRPDPNSDLLQTLFMLTTAGIPIPRVQAVGALPGVRPLSGPSASASAGVGAGVGNQVAQGQTPGTAQGIGSDQPPVPTVGGPTTAASISRLGNPQPITNPLRTRLRQ